MRLSAVRWKAYKAFDCLFVAGLLCFVAFPRCWGAVEDLKFNKHKLGPLVADEQVSEGSMQPSKGLGRAINPAKIKTEMCRSVREDRACKYGKSCKYAYSLDELCTVVRHPKYKTENCRNFHKTGFCAYGVRCHFVHDDSESQQTAFKVQTLPMPASSLSSKKRYSQQRIHSEARADKKTIFAPPSSEVDKLPIHTLPAFKAWHDIARQQVDQLITDTVKSGDVYLERPFSAESKESLRQLSLYYLMNHSWVDGLLMGALLNGISINYVPYGKENSIAVFQIAREDETKRYQDLVHITAHLFLAMSDPRINTILTQSTFTEIRLIWQALPEVSSDPREPLPLTGTADLIYQLLYVGSEEAFSQVQLILNIFVQEGYIDQGRTPAMTQKIMEFVHTHLNGSHQAQASYSGHD